MGLIKVIVEKCQRDGICVEVCPVGILALSREGIPVIRPGLAKHCIGCGHCVAVCPSEALDNSRNRLTRQTRLQRFPVITPDVALLFLRSRRSVRRYDERSVPKEAVLPLLEAARYAPSGHNTQGVSFLIIDEKEALNKIKEKVIEWMAYTVERNKDWARKLNFPSIIKAHGRGEDRVLRNAPGLIIANAPKDLGTAQITTYLALEYVELYATTLGLGTCWAGYTQMCAQQYPPLVDYLKMPDGQAITGVMMYGYPKYFYHRLPDRNPLNVRWFET